MSQSTWNSSPSTGVAVDVGDAHAVAAKLDELVLVDRPRGPGVGDERGHVAGEEVLAVAEPDDERQVAPGADDEVGLVAVRDDENVRAVEVGADRAHRGREVAVVPLLDQVRDRFGVGLARERVAALLEPVAQLGEVLQRAVVDDGDRAGAVDVRMRVAVVRRAVGRPAGVADAERARADRRRSASASAACRLASLPARRTTVRSPASSRIATPAES